MTEEKFIAKYEKNWESLEGHIKNIIARGLKSYSKAEIKSFAHLFRLTGYNLAYAKTHFSEGRALPYLNRLVGRAHNIFYVPESGGFSDICKYFLYGFPQAVRNSLKPFAASAGMFFFGLLFASIFLIFEPGWIYQIYPQGAIEGPIGVGGWDYPLMSAVIMTNNIRVSVMAFALGIFGGVGTIYVLFYNGLIIGAIVGHLININGDFNMFLSLIMPNGVWELTAIFLSGACCLMIGRAILIPGSFTRKNALVFAARKAAALIPGIVLLLVLAGLIEGFFTPLDIPAVFKHIFSCLAFVILILYISGFRRKQTGRAI